MGDVDANGYGRGNHVYGPGPAPYAIEVDTTHSGQPLAIHWEAKGVNELTATTAAQRDDLHDGAVAGQDDFDDAAAEVADWYDTFAGLTAAEESDCKQRMRRAWRQT